MAGSPDPAGRGLAVPFNRPSFVGGEWERVQEAVAEGKLSGDGRLTRRCEALLSPYFDGARVLLTPSCTQALEMAALLLDSEPGDEVVVPSFTFVSTANAFVLRGARPVFCDIDPDTLNLDPGHLAELVTERTAAIVPVHYAGVGCEMDRIMAIAERVGAAVVEDNAHGLFGSRAGRRLGTFGRLAAQSFHETKNLSCGEGGALVINDQALVERAEILREKGTDRTRFFRGQVDKYTWQDVGSSYLLSEVSAALLLCQLEAAERIQLRRREVWERYDRELAAWASKHEVQRPVIPDDAEQPYHLFHLRLPEAADRDAMIAHLRRDGILATFHYVPLHLSPMGRRFGGRPGLCPVTEDVSARLVRLPLYNDMTEAEQARVIESVLAFVPGQARA